MIRVSTISLMVRNPLCSIMNHPFITPSYRRTYMAALVWSPIVAVIVAVAAAISFQIGNLLDTIIYWTIRFLLSEIFAPFRVADH